VAPLLRRPDGAVWRRMTCPTSLRDVEPGIRQVETLRTPPYAQETADPFAEWSRIGVPVRLFPAGCAAPTPEWEAFIRPEPTELPDFTTRRKPPRPRAGGGCGRWRWSPRLREVAALYGFTDDAVRAGAGLVT
jgi:hypothetical protein